ncbi:MAG: hypothetical protein MUO23_11500, partial [Anaerolineales bacterium]|nr:hypothetical protein [Anaerolineales bacterium]
MGDFGLGISGRAAGWIFLSAVLAGCSGPFSLFATPTPTPTHTPTATPTSTVTLTPTLTVTPT